jgi:hypothetical protein
MDCHGHSSSIRSFHHCCPRDMAEEAPLPQTRRAQHILQRRHHHPHSAIRAKIRAHGETRSKRLPTSSSTSRTRDAFMPYGYNYTRSESRLASGASASDDAIEHVQPPPPIVAAGRSSPLARGGTPVGDLERGGIEGTPTPTGQVKRKKVLVRERSVEDDVGTPTKTPMPGDRTRS